ncbi:MAG: ABC transporter ATP-binding protein [Candidatus Thermoplasmatota archaeon]|jgi:ABC-2 type transport system ATP-binding protein|nr:ABC transporter ATP-binding protein [Candidatus Thermoplasmatota archaeon]MEC9076052.1 ABC transporter ATP-binding protein [Candidatus Thermoplasmatota archaeon]MEC9146150.1 ABC transporter ATP-binding protein [Candidatus Thermoplasmatota archaeon]MEE2625918.1 ABC transporter ATP-binding protein [Candidatus Thermoplasmatota archaeon]|tara:strand:- start:773 stop:1705 length:933 start_codon:yes stop_codon:yes gene_type:complete
MTSELPAVMLESVSKWYGEVIGINDVSLAIDGGVTGVLGPNGAGKSTLFKLLLGRLRPSQGSVRLFGTDPWESTSPFRRVGYVSETEPLYEWMTALDFLTTMARLHGMTRDEAKERAEHVLDFVGLTDVRHKEVGKYSKGMRQRVKIAHALVHDPDLIILDEPLHGCDPLARTSIMSVIRELGNRGKTVIVSSHILEEIERITEQIVILHNGRLLALGNLHAIRGLLDKHPHRIMLETESPRELAKELISEDPIYGVRFPEEGCLEIQTGDLSEAHAILPNAIVKSGIKVTSVENPDDNLDSLLGYLVGG